MTTADWDFSSANWALSTSYYVSSPSSVRLRSGVGPTMYTLLKTSVVPISDLKEGMIVTQIMQRENNWHHEIVFRFQDEDNYYCIYIKMNAGADVIQLKKRKDASNTLLKTGTSADWIDAYQWKKIRIRWWNDAIGLLIKMDRWDGSQWVEMLSYYDTPNEWKDIGGRVGFGGINVSTGGNSGSWYYDDTEIWGS